MGGGVRRRGRSSSSTCRDPENFGVVVYDDDGRAIDIVEKAGVVDMRYDVPPSKDAVVGLYCYPPDVFDVHTPGSTGRTDPTCRGVAGAATWPRGRRSPAALARAMLSAVEIGVLGATGPAGKGWRPGSRTPGHDAAAVDGRAEATVEELRAKWGDRVGCSAATNAEARRPRDLVVHRHDVGGRVATARSTPTRSRGKVVISMANGLERIGDEFHVVLPDGRLVAEAVQAAAPDGAGRGGVPPRPGGGVRGARRPDRAATSSSCGDDDDARRLVLELVVSIPELRAFDGGSLANAIGLEAFAALLLSINIRHKGKASLRLAGVDGAARGARMTLRLFDTAQRAVVPFEPGHVVRMYVCGITPYDSTHLGHAATYLAYDLLIRRLEELGHEVRMVRNVTDVDDSILPKARELGDPVPRARGVGARPLPLRHGRARHAPADRRAARDRGDRRDDRHDRTQLLDSGHAYLTHGTVYFDVSTFPRFGELSHYSRDHMVRLARAARGQPRRPAPPRPARLRPLAAVARRRAGVARAVRRRSARAGTSSAR